MARRACLALWGLLVAAQDAPSDAVQRCRRDGPGLAQEWLYVAHVDAPKYLSALRQELLSDTKLPPDGEVDTFSTVIGSWSFLSLLPVLRPKTIVMFDVNPAAAAFAAMLVGLLKVAPTRRGFLRYILGREVGAEDMRAFEAEAIAYMQGDAAEEGWPRTRDLPPSGATKLLERPLDAAVVSEAARALEAVPPEEPVWVSVHSGGDVTRERSVPSAACTYLELADGFLSAPLGRPAQDGLRWRICEQIGVVGNPSNAPVSIEKAGGSHPEPGNICSLFFSHGWLASEATFDLVRSRLLAAKREYKVLNIVKEGQEPLSCLVRGHETSVLYLSNIQPDSDGDWANKWAMSGKLEDWIQRIARGGGYLRLLNRDRWFKFASRPHLTALAAVERALGVDVSRLPEASRGLPLNRGALPLAEIVAQDLRVHPGWGFHELNRSRLQHHADFAQEAWSLFPRDGNPYVLPMLERVCILHILVGEGVPHEVFLTALKLATVTYRRVAVLEHNRRSEDFAEMPAAEREHFLDPDSLRAMVRQICGGPQRQLSDCGLVRVECAYGAKDHCRNFVGLVEVFGTALQRPNMVRRAAGLEVAA